MWFMSPQLNVMIWWETQETVFDNTHYNCIIYIAAPWETYIQARMQQLELDMEQQTGSK